MNRVDAQEAADEAHDRWLKRRRLPRHLYVAFRRHPHDEREGSGHVTVQVFVGRMDHSRGHAGDVVMRNDEWADLEASLRGHPGYVGGPDVETPDVLMTIGAVTFGLAAS